VAQLDEFAAVGRIRTTARHGPIEPWTAR
jgi:hypothetical protein